MTNALLDDRVIEQLVADTGPSVLPDLLSAFVEEMAELAPRLADALDHDDYLAVARDIHSLKSSSGTFGALALRGLAEGMDSAYKQGELDSALELGVELHLRIRETIAALQARYPLRVS